MPLVPIKYVVSFSSQDEKHPVHNLIGQDAFKKWLCNPQDRTGLMEATFQLDYPCVISYINIGSVWCATVEVRVGRSDWPTGREFETLIHTVSLMSPADCTLSKNPVKTEMFTTDSFCQEIAKQKWDRIKVLCRQPYKKLTQFGLSFLHIQTSMAVQTYVTGTSGKAADQPADHASVNSIKQHFLGKIQDGGNKANNELKFKLLKIAASSDSGAEHSGALSRTAKLVLAASGGGKNPASHGAQTPDSVKRGLYSSHLDKKYGPEFEEEVKQFLFRLTLNPSELDNITLADVRHRFEKRKRRKLTKEEKKKFAELTTETLASVFDDDYPTKTNSRLENTTSKYDSSQNKDKCQTPNNVRGTGDEISNLTLNVNPVETMQKDSRLKLKIGNISKDNCHATADNKNNDYDFDIGKSKPNPKTPGTKQEDEKRKMTPAGKRKLSLSSDTVMPPSKKKLLVKGDIKEEKTKKTYKKITDENCQVFSEKPINKENTFACLNNEQKELNLRDGIPRKKKKPEDEMEKSFDMVAKAITPLKDSKFGEFLLNVTISSSDDENDDDILFPKQKVPRSGKRKNKGRKKKSSQNDNASLLDSPSTSVGLEKGINAKKGRGRGSGSQKKTKARSNASSLEIRPTGFARCEGCSDYFDAQLLSIHQSKCIQWKAKQDGEKTTTDTPWLCTRPQNPPASSKKNKSADVSVTTPPGLMAAMAAERRLKQKSDRNNHSSDACHINVGESSRNDLIDDNSLIQHPAWVVEEQKKALEQFSKLKRNTLKSDTESNCENQTISKALSNVDKQWKHFNQSKGYILANNQSISRHSDCLNLTISDDDTNTTESLMDDLQMVECPLCGDLLPSSVIEQHASNCMV